MTATIIEESSDELHEKQKHGRRYGRRQTSLVFGSGWTALGFIESNNNNNNKRKAWKGEMIKNFRKKRRV